MRGCWGQLTPPGTPPAPWRPHLALGQRGEGEEVPRDSCWGQGNRKCQRWQRLPCQRPGWFHPQVPGVRPGRGEALASGTASKGLPTTRA